MVFPFITQEKQGEAWSQGYRGHQTPQSAENDLPDLGEGDTGEYAAEGGKLGR